MRILEFIEKDGQMVPNVREMTPEEEERYNKEGEDEK